MNRPLRAVALLLVGCLIADPVTASGLQGVCTLPQNISLQDSAPAFRTQALSPAFIAAVFALPFVRLLTAHVQAAAGQAAETAAASSSTNLEWLRATTQEMVHLGPWGWALFFVGGVIVSGIVWLVLTSPSLKDGPASGRKIVFAGTVVLAILTATNGPFLWYYSHTYLKSREASPKPALAPAAAPASPPVEPPPAVNPAVPASPPAEKELFGFGNDPGPQTVIESLPDGQPVATASPAQPTPAAAPKPSVATPGSETAAAPAGAATASETTPAPTARNRVITLDSSPLTLSTKGLPAQIYESAVFNFPPGTGSIFVEITVTPNTPVQHVWLVVDGPAYDPMGSEGNRFKFGRFGTRGKVRVKAGESNSNLTITIRGSSQTSLNLPKRDTSGPVARIFGAIKWMFTADLIAQEQEPGTTVQPPVIPETHELLPIVKKFEEDLIQVQNLVLMWYQAGAKSSAKAKSGTPDPDGQKEAAAALYAAVHRAIEVLEEDITGLDNYKGPFLPARLIKEGFAKRNLERYQQYLTHIQTLKPAKAPNVVPSPTPTPAAVVKRPSEKGFSLTQAVMAFLPLTMALVFMIPVITPHIQAFVVFILLALLGPFVHGVSAFNLRRHLPLTQRLTTAA